MMKLQRHALFPLALLSTLLIQGCANNVAKTPANIPAPVVVQKTTAKPADVVAFVPAPTFTVSPNDVTMRDTLEKWSRDAGFTFTRELWTVPFDLPVIGTETFTGDYKTAVRALVATSELTDRPLQPCFYNNNVLRIVSTNEVCDRFTAR
ncbi:toxin co-regulated pilus biosynthesis Q family protein [Escherichia coli]|nr:toxin co-regulated pilus biosynthesis Q family protein [Escherichia coli]